MKKKMKKGKRELIIEIGREQVLYSDFKKELDKRVKEIAKYDENVQCTDNVDLYIPKGQIFLMGDNRDFSKDSRTIGCVPLKNIKGKVITFKK